MDRPIQVFLIASQVDRPAFWTTSSSPAAVMAMISAHLPQGAQLSGHGYSGSELFATYAFPTIDPTSLGARQLVLEALGQPGGGSVVRADAEVRYIAPRRIAPQGPTQPMTR